MRELDPEEQRRWDEAAEQVLLAEIAADLARARRDQLDETRRRAMEALAEIGTAPNGETGAAIAKPLDATSRGLHASA